LLNSPSYQLCTSLATLPGDRHPNLVWSCSDKQPVLLLLLLLPLAVTGASNMPTCCLGSSCNANVVPEVFRNW
jgi:hypothetical protein